MKVLILHKNGSRAYELACTIEADLKARGIETAIREAHNAASWDLQDVTLIIVLGGDGTILETARVLTGSDIHLLGINFGKIGFLSSIEPEDWPMVREKIINQQYTLEKRMTIETKIVRNGQTLNLGRALNDAVIRSQVLHIVTLRLYINGIPYAIYRADGVVCATPAGSTAYSYSAGGPVLAGDLDAMVISPICPQLSCSRSLVVKGDDQLEFAIDCDCTSRIALDGETEMDLIKGDRILMQQSRETVNFVQINSVSSMEKIMHCRYKMP